MLEGSTVLDFVSLRAVEAMASKACSKSFILSCLEGSMARGEEDTMMCLLCVFVDANSRMGNLLNSKDPPGNNVLWGVGLDALKMTLFLEKDDDADDNLSGS